jgi:hypothetical protein
MMLFCFLGVRHVENHRTNLLPNRRRLLWMATLASCASGGNARPKTAIPVNKSPHRTSQKT